jgi:hypothetical protein
LLGVDGGVGVGLAWQESQVADHLAVGQRGIPHLRRHEAIALAVEPVVELGADRVRAPLVRRRLGVGRQIGGGIERDGVGRIGRGSVGDVRVERGIGRGIGVSSGGGVGQRDVGACRKWQVGGGVAGGVVQRGGRRVRFCRVRVANFESF